MDGAPHNFQLLEPPSPEALVPDSLLETWMVVVAAAVIILLVILIIWLLKRRKNAAIDPFAARNAAYKEAVAALDAMKPDTTTRDAAVRCSLITRKYLSTAAGDPALFETHEEYISRHEALKSFSEQARTAAQKDFSRLAALKYSAEIPDAAAGDVISESRNLLETLHQGLQA